MILIIKRVNWKRFYDSRPVFDKASIMTVAALDMYDMSYITHSLSLCYVIMHSCSVQFMVIMCKTCFVIASPSDRASADATMFRSLYYTCLDLLRQSLSFYHNFGVATFNFPGMSVTFYNLMLLKLTM